MLYLLTVSVPGYYPDSSREANIYFESEQCPTKEVVLQKLLEESKSHQQFIDEHPEFCVAINEYALVVSSILLCSEFPILPRKTCVMSRVFFKSTSFRCRGSISLHRIGKVLKL